MHKARTDNLRKALAHVLQHVLARHPHGHVTAGFESLQGSLQQPLPVASFQQPLYMKCPAPYDAGLLGVCPAITPPALLRYSQKLCTVSITTVSQVIILIKIVTLGNSQLSNFVYFLMQTLPFCLFMCKGTRLHPAETRFPRVSLRKA